MSESGEQGTERQQAPTHGESARFRVTLRPPNGSERTIVVDEREVVLVGQSPACALQVPDALVSRRHLSLEVERGLLRVRDLGTTNGSFLGKTRFADIFLSGGEHVSIGRSTLQVNLAEATQSIPVLPQPSALQSTSFAGVLGESLAMRRLYPLLTRLAHSNVPVLVEGETGTGKEVVARAIHEVGERKGGPLVVFDCTTAAPSVIESELFGHERGAFTGAQATRAGLFEQAHRGTLFIDELGDLPLDLQAKLLRAIERSEVRRVGGREWIRCDVRIVAATRRDLEDMVVRGQFRDDLFHRLAVARVELPPLRKRPDDIRRLALHFAEEAEAGAQLPERLLAEWSRRPWPGNVRELRNAVFRYVALGDLLDAPDVDSMTCGFHEVPLEQALAREGFLEEVVRLAGPYPLARDRVHREFERLYTERIVELAGGNVTKGAQLAGVALRYFQQLRARCR